MLRRSGFTFIELIVVIMLILWIVLFVFGIFRGNFWYSESSALRELRADHPQITEVLKTKRNIFSKSIITVKENGIGHDYCLDTDILWNYEFSECRGK